MAILHIVLYCIFVYSQTQNLLMISVHYYPDIFKSHSKWQIEYFQYSEE